MERPKSVKDLLVAGMYCGEPDVEMYGDAHPTKIMKDALERTLVQNDFPIGLSNHDVNEIQQSTKTRRNITDQEIIEENNLSVEDIADQLNKAVNTEPVKEKTPEPPKEPANKSFNFHFYGNVNMYFSKD